MYKIIKTTPFTAQGVDHTNYMVAHKGYIFKVSTLVWDASDITVNGTTLSLKGDKEIRRNPYQDDLGQTKIGLELMPKLDLTLSALSM